MEISDRRAGVGLGGCYVYAGWPAMGRDHSGIDVYRVFSAGSSTLKQDAF